MSRKNILSLVIVSAVCLMSCKKNTNAQPEKSTNIAAVQNNAPKDSVNNTASFQQSKTETPVAEKEIAPSKADGIRQDINKIEGRFVAENCENGRFSIVIAEVSHKLTFKIYDKAKIILSGKAETSINDDGSTTIGMGKMGGMFADDKITVQNYGNSMNEYENFTQCEDKYLEFTRK
ncbi:hypothetical protein [Chryseobacterium sp. SIMBA_029]|uniref:hypothetical protein n=1 Tax=Chryseobacterium sp. SIMBA_029 TaxID=3085772 RepID=UPI0039785299